MPEIGGYLWGLLTVVGVVALAGGLAYGTIQWRKRPRDPHTEAVRDEATRALFDKRH